MGVLAEEAVRIRADTSGFHAEASRGILSSATRIVGTVGAIFAGAKIGKALFVDPIKSAGNFEQALDVLQATSGATDAKMKKLSATAMKLGADTKLPAVSATDAANAMLELAKGGFSAQQAMDAARGTLLLSTAAEIDGAAAATLVADNLHAFGLEAGQAGVLVDDFAGAANASTATMSDVGLALSQSGQAFHELGIPVGDATTAIAAMANAGIKGSDAGTSLKTMLQRLNPVTKGAKQAFADMNIDVFDQQGKFIGLDATIKQFAPKLADMTQKQRQHALQTIFGSDAQRAANVILGMSAEKFEKLRDRVTKAGQAQKLADAQTKGFNGAMKALGSAVETLQLRIGLALLPKITSLVRWLGRIASAPNLSVAIKIAWTGIKEFAGNVEKAISDALFGSSKLVRIGSSGSRVVVDQGLIAKIQASIAEGIERTDWTSVGNNIGDAISAAIHVTSDALNELLDGLMAWVDAHRSQIADVGLVIGLTMISHLLDPSFWAAHWQLIGGIVLSAMAVIFPEGRLAQIGLRAVEFLLKPFAMLGTRLLALGTEGVLRLAGSIEAAIGPLGGRIALWLGDAILRATSTVVGAMVSLGARMIEGFINRIAGLGVIFRTAAFTAIVTVIGNLVGLAVRAASDLASRVANAIMSLPGKLADLAAQLIARVVGAVTGASGSAATAANNLATRIANGIKTAPARLAGLAGDLAGRIQAAAGQAAGSAFSYMRQVGFSIADGIISGVGNLGSRLAGALMSGIGSAKDAALGFLQHNSPSKLFRDTVGASIGEGTVVGAEQSMDKLAPALIPKIRETVAKLTGVTKEEGKKVAAAFGDWATEAKKAYDAKADGILASVNAQFTRAQAALEKWKATLTPAEAQIQAAAARAAAVSAQAAVDKAWLDLKALPAAQQQAFDTLLAQQRANMAQLQATLTSSRDDTILAEDKFQQGLAGAGGNPFASTLLGAQQTFNFVKQQFDQGVLDQTAFVNASRALEAAKLQAQQAIDAASAGSTETTEAQKTAASQAEQAQRLLDDYVTWQTLGVQSTAAAAAVTAQQAADGEAQLALRASQNQQTIEATAAKDNALQGLLDYNLGEVAKKERADRDRAATELNAALVWRHDRYITHFENVKKIHERAYDDLLKMADTSGKQTGNQLAIALESMIPRIGRAAAAVAAELRKYLKLSSPSEKGPLSDLDKWWGKLTPTLLSSLDVRGLQAALTEATTPQGRSGGRPTAPLGRANVPGLGYQSTSRIEFLLEQLVKSSRQQKPPTTVEVHVPGSVGIDASTYRSRR